MKHVIRLTESDLHNLVRHSVKNILREIDEMGTPKQNAFLRKLMGDRYKSEYDNYSVPDTSKMIDQELANQRNGQQGKLATPNQISSIENSKYFPLPAIRQAEGKLTFDDAKTLLDALNPYTNGMYTYYGHSRERKERWLPRMKDVVVPILEKYGLTQEANRVTQYVDNFMNKHNAKLDRESKKKLAQRMQELESSPMTLFFMSSEDEDRQNINTERLSHEMYMDGELETAMHWDIPVLITDKTQITKEEIENYAMRMPGVHYDALVKGYDRPCSAVFWIGYNIAGRPTLAGLLVDVNDLSKAIKYAKERHMKEIDGARLQ